MKQKPKIDSGGYLLTFLVSLLILDQKKPKTKNCLLKEDESIVTVEGSENQSLASLPNSTQENKLLVHIM